MIVPNGERIRGIMCNGEWVEAMYRDGELIWARRQNNGFPYTFPFIFGE